MKIHKIITWMIVILFLASAVFSLEVIEGDEDKKLVNEAKALLKGLKTIEKTSEDKIKELPATPPTGTTPSTTASTTTGRGGGTGASGGGMSTTNIALIAVVAVLGLGGGVGFWKRKDIGDAIRRSKLNKLIRKLHEAATDLGDHELLDSDDGGLI